MLSNVDNITLGTLNEKQTKPVERLTQEVELLNTATSEYNASSTNLAKKMVKLTWVIAGLTLFMFIGLVVQIVLATSDK